MKKQLTEAEVRAKRQAEAKNEHEQYLDAMIEIKKQNPHQWKRMEEGMSAAERQELALHEAKKKCS